MNNKEIKTRRMLSYFIRSAQAIMKEEGISGITLRKVADGAGYNTATIYNYFDDLDHVILFASLKYLQIYNQELDLQLKGSRSAKDTFFISWDTFCKISFQYPEAFHQIFFTRHSSDLDLICKQYYDIFPEEQAASSSSLYPIISDYRLLTRNYLVLEPLLKENGQTTANIDLMNELIVSAYQHLLSDCLSAKSAAKDSLQQYTDRMLQYLTFILHLNTGP